MGLSLFVFQYSGASCATDLNDLILTSGGDWSWSYFGVLYISECRAAACGAQHLERRDGGVFGPSHRLASLLDSP